MPYYYVSAQELAKMLGVSSSTINKAIKSGVITRDTIDWYGRPTFSTEYAESLARRAKSVRFRGHHRIMGFIADRYAPIPEVRRKGPKIARGIQRKKAWEQLLSRADSSVALSPEEGAARIRAMYPGMRAHKKDRRLGKLKGKEQQPPR